MGNATPWSSLPRYWVHIQLPGYRALPRHNTYEASRLEDLPPIPFKLDDDCSWLTTYGRVQAQGGLSEHEMDLEPASIVEIANAASLDLPHSFKRFMTSPGLQSRVRSCTDCYLDPGERIVETFGSIRGHLVHFLSDSQSCAHWYLHVLPNGESAVLESPDLYCYQIENSDWIENPSCRQERVDFKGLDFVYCAPSFSDFLYRFWIENEIWYGLRHEASRCQLQSLELNYITHYSSKMLRIWPNQPYFYRDEK